jgi:hypothetical protein
MPQTIRHTDPAKRVPADVRRQAELIGGVRCYACPPDAVPSVRLIYVPLDSGGLVACERHARSVRHG